MHTDKYYNSNRLLWNKKTQVHLQSEFYNLDEFKKGKTSLTDLEISELGSVKDKSLLHLQCHFGQDSLSLARLGADVTGVDISDQSIAHAKILNQELGLNAKFICCNIYDLPNYLDKKFDIVFTSFGVLSWLPDLSIWARLIDRFLKKDGFFYLAEFHPVVWMFSDDFTHIQYSYFNDGPIKEDSLGSYANRKAEISGESYTWNHSLSDIFTSLNENGLAIQYFHEYPFSYHNCFQNTQQEADGLYRIKGLENKIPMIFSLKATKIPTADIIE